MKPVYSSICSVQQCLQYALCSISKLCKSRTPRIIDLVHVAPVPAVESVPGALKPWRLYCDLIKLPHNSTLSTSMCQIGNQDSQIDRLAACSNLDWAKNQDGHTRLIWMIANSALWHNISCCKSHTVKFGMFTRTKNGWWGQDRFVKTVSYMLTTPPWLTYLQHVSTVINHKHVSITRHVV